MLTRGNTCSTFFREELPLVLEIYRSVPATAMAGTRVSPSLFPCVFPLVHFSVRQSVLLSFRLSGRFFEIYTLVFSAILHGIRIYCGVVHKRARFLRKSSIWKKNDQKWLRVAPKWGFSTILIKSFLNKKWYFCLPAQTPYLENSFSRVTAGKTLNRSYCRTY